MLVLVLINIDGEEKIEMIPSFPGHLNYSRTLISEGSGGERVMLPTYLVVLHNIGQMTHQLENICRLGQPVVITGEEGFVAIKTQQRSVSLTCYWAKTRIKYYW